MTNPGFITIANNALTLTMPWLPSDKKSRFKTAISVTTLPVTPDNNSTNIVIRKVEEPLVAVRAQLEKFARETEDVELQTPETFTLQPLSRRQVKVRIIQRNTPAFQYVVDDELTIEDVAE